MSHTISGTNAADAQKSIEAYETRRAILEKSWDACSAEEKLEKVREELQQLGHLLQSVNNIYLEIAKLKEHDHKDGKIVIPLNTSALNGFAAIGGLASRRNNLQ